MNQVLYSCSIGCGGAKIVHRRALQVVAAVLVLAAEASGIGPDSFGYTATTDVIYSFLNISSSGVRILAGSDDDTALVNIGFPFNFYGTQYTSLCISTNGLVSFGGCNADFVNIDLTAASPKGDLPSIAPLWTDLTFNAAGADAVYYQTLGTAGSRRFVIEWNNAYGLNTPRGITLELVLVEGTNTILFQYQSLDAGAPAVNSGAGATVGIRGASGQLNGRVLQWSMNAPVLTNSLAIAFLQPGGVAPIDVSGLVTINSSGLLYNRATQTFNGTITILNKSTGSIPPPLQIVFTNLTPGVTLADTYGTTPNGPYLTVPGTTALGPGQKLVVNVRFRDPTNAVIKYIIKTYSGAF
jgi:hypothetical protein